MAAYEGLSQPFQRFVDTLRAEHKYGANWSGLPRPGRAKLAERFGVSPIESRLILGYLFDEIARAEYQVRFRWEPGSVAPRFVSRPVFASAGTSA